MRLRMPACGRDAAAPPGARDRPTVHSCIRRCRAPIRSSTPASATPVPRSSRWRTAPCSGGIAFGAPVASGGDLVVNTSQTGYQEIATDPSYAGQVVVMTYPLIGNYGRLHADDQSARPWLRGLVVAHATAAVLDDARQLATLLRSNGIPAIAGVDTRALARHLRRPARCAGSSPSPGMTDRDAAVDAGPRRPALGGPGLRRPGLAGARSASTATTRRRRWSRSSTTGSRRTSSARLGRRGVRVRVLPHTASRGGRPRRRRRGRRALARARRPGPARRVPSRWPGRSSTTAGRCWASASGTRSSGARRARRRGGSGSATTARTTRSRTSTRATSRSPRRTTRSRSSATACPASSGFRVSQVNLNDRSVEGLRHAEKPIETVQYHPEGAPGPLDALAVFDRFVEALPAGRERLAVADAASRRRPCARIARSRRRS